VTSLLYAFWIHSVVKEMWDWVSQRGGCDVTQCSLAEVNRRFWGMCCLKFQDCDCILPAYFWFISDPKNGGYTLLRNCSECLLVCTLRCRIRLDSTAICVRVCDITTPVSLKVWHNCQPEICITYTESTRPEIIGARPTIEEFLTFALAALEYQGGDSMYTCSNIFLGMHPARCYTCFYCFPPILQRSREQSYLGALGVGIKLHVNSS
jgi:hypothetical protein